MIDLLKKIKDPYFLKKFLGSFQNMLLSIKLSWKSSRTLFITRVIVEVFISIVPIELAVLLKSIINLLSNQIVGQANKDYSILITALSFYLIFQLINMVLGKINTICTHIHQDIIGNNIDLQIIKKTNSLDISFFDSSKFYDEILNAANDSQALQTLTWIVLDLIRGIVSVLFCFYILGNLHWSIPVVILLLNIPTMAIEKKYIKINYDWQRARSNKQRKMIYFKNILTTKPFAKELRIYNLQNYMTDQFTKSWKEWYKERKRIAFFRGLWSALSSILPYSATVFILGFVGIAIINKQLTLGDFSLYSSMTTMYVSGISNIFSAITQVYENEIKLTNFKNFLNWAPLFQPTGCLKVKSPLQLEFKNVSFRYPNTERLSLTNISFKINENEKIAIVGLNGAGKTTIVKLILRLYEPTEGSILINDIDISKYEIEDLRKSFGVVFQDYCNYALTLKDNISISDINSKKSEIEFDRVCKAAGMEGILKKLSNKYETFLTKQFDKNGEELSGGEWQKVAIARAFYPDSKFMIMDEPTSSLDPEAEYKLYETMADLCKYKSAIFISHRLSSVIMADKILVLDNGEIIEAGNHKDLIEIDGKYAHLFKLQAERYKY